MGVVRRRVRVVAASCVLVVAWAVLLTGARAWAAAQTEARCSRVPHTVTSTPAIQTGAERGLPRPVERAPSHSWRSPALRTAGCSAWHEVRHRMHQRHGA